MLVRKKTTLLGAHNSEINDSGYGIKEIATVKVRLEGE